MDRKSVICQPWAIRLSRFVDRRGGLWSDERYRARHSSSAEPISMEALEAAREFVVERLEELAAAGAPHARFDWTDRLNVERSARLFEILRRLPPIPRFDDGSVYGVAPHFVDSLDGRKVPAYEAQAFQYLSIGAEIYQDLYGAYCVCAANVHVVKCCGCAGFLFTYDPRIVVCDRCDLRKKAERRRLNRHADELAEARRSLEVNGDLRELAEREYGESLPNLDSLRPETADSLRFLKAYRRARREDITYR